MAMSDCIKCWNTPCTCGYEYRDYSKRGRLELAAAVLGVHVDALEIVTRPIIRAVHPMAEKQIAEVSPAKAAFMEEICKPNKRRKCREKT